MQGKFQFSIINKQRPVINSKGKDSSAVAKAKAGQEGLKINIQDSK